MATQREQNRERGKSIWPVGCFSQWSTSGESDCLLTSSETHQTPRRPSPDLIFKKHDLQNTKSLRSCKLRGCTVLQTFKTAVIFFVLSYYPVPAPGTVFLLKASCFSGSTPLNLSIQAALAEICSFNPLHSISSVYASSEILLRLALPNLLAFFFSIFFFFYTFPSLHLSLHRISHSTFQPKCPYLPSGHLSQFL